MSEVRLIDANNVINALNVFSDMEHGNEHFMHGINSAKEIVNECETADAVPIVRGEWVAEQKGAEYCEFRCSSCDGSIGQTDQYDETEVKQFSEWYKYCPCCGARMDGES